MYEIRTLLAYANKYACAFANSFLKFGLYPVTSPRTFQHKIIWSFLVDLN